MGQLVVVAASINIEVSVAATCPDHIPENLRGRKHIVTSVTKMSSGYRIEMGESQIEIGVRDGSERRFAAGGSYNVALALRKLGVDGVAIVAPVGGNGEREFLREEMKREGIAFLPLEADQTPFTLAVQTPGETTLFCVKSPYRVPTEEEVDEMLRGRAIDHLILTSVKESDLTLAMRLSGRARVVGLMPHAQLLERDHRGHFVLLGRVANMVQVNDDEASKYLDMRYTAGDVRVISEAIGHRDVVVTRGEAGSEFCGEHRVIATPATTAACVHGTSGAGDAHFAAYYYFRYLYDLHLAQTTILRLAAWVAARKVEHESPTHMPSTEELAEVIRVERECAHASDR